MTLRRFLFTLFACCVLGPPGFAQATAGPFTLTANAQCTPAIDTTGLSTLGMQVTGTFTLTLQPEVSLGGQAPVNTQVTPSTSSTPQSTITTTGVYSASVAGAKNFLLCVSAYTSGSATIYFQGSNLSAHGIGGGGGGGGGGTPGGSNGDIQYNNSGAFGGSATTINAAGSITVPANQSIAGGTNFTISGGNGQSFSFDVNCQDSAAVGGFCLEDNAASGLFFNGTGSVSLSGDGASCAGLTTANEVQIGCSTNNVVVTSTAATAFNSSGISIAGSSSGTSTVKAPATGGGTATFPAGSGTLCYTSTCLTSVPSTVCSPGSFAAQTDGATVTWAIASAVCANASLLFTTHGGSRTLNLTGLVNGGSYVLKITQDATGGEGLTLGTGCTWKVSGGGSGAITPSTGANAVDVLAFTYDGTNCLLNFAKNFS